MYKDLLNHESLRKRDVKVNVSKTTNTRTFIFKSPFVSFLSKFNILLVSLSAFDSRIKKNPIKDHI